MKVYDEKKNLIGFLNARNETISADPKTDVSYPEEEKMLSERYDRISLKGLRDLFVWMLASEIVLFLGFFTYNDLVELRPECCGSFLSLSVRAIALICFLFVTKKVALPAFVILFIQFSVAVLLFYVRPAIAGTSAYEIYILCFFCECAFLSALYLTYKSIYEKLAGRNTVFSIRKLFRKPAFIVPGLIAFLLLMWSLYLDKESYDLYEIRFSGAGGKEMLFASAWLIFFVLRMVQFLLAGMKLSKILKKETMSI